MSSSRRKSSSTAPATQYAEVESDVDMDDDAVQIGEAKAAAARARVEQKQKQVNPGSDDMDQDTGDEDAASDAGDERPRKRSHHDAKTEHEENVSVVSDGGASGSTNAQQAKDADNSSAIKKEKGPLEDMLRMPMDVFHEILSHLPPPTLLDLCRTAKIFRSLLLSRSGRSIWVSSRLRHSIPTLHHHDLDEVQYAVFAFGKTVCKFCGRWANRLFDHFLLVCPKCFKANTITAAKVKTLDPRPHASAALCVVGVEHWERHFGRGHYLRRFLTDELMEVSAKLYELAAQDAQEAEDRSILRLRTQGSRSRRAHHAVPDGLDLSQPPTDRVKAYIKQREQLVQNRVKERDDVNMAIADYNWNARQEENEKQRRLEAERRRLADIELEKERLLDAQLISIGWTQEIVNASKQNWTWSAEKKKLGEVGSDNAKDWQQLKTRIEEDELKKEQERQDREKAAREADAAREAQVRKSERKEYVKSKYYKLRDARLPEHLVKFPTLFKFYDLPSVKPMWEPEEEPVLIEEDGGDETQAVSISPASGGSSSTVQSAATPTPATVAGSRSSADASTSASGDGHTIAVLETRRDARWRLSLDAILLDVEAYQEDVRRQLIRQILSATTDKSIKKISDDPDDYPTNEYGRAFFDKITHRFVVDYRAVNSWQTIRSALPYPDVLAKESHPSTSVQSVNAIRAILKLGRLDEDTATVADVDNLGKVRWLDYPLGIREKREWDWKELVPEIAQRTSKIKSKTLRLALAATPATTATSSNSATTALTAATSSTSNVGNSNASVSRQAHSRRRLVVESDSDPD